MDTVRHDTLMTAGETGQPSMAVAGDIDAANADDVRTAILNAAGTTGTRLEVDLSGVTFMDSSGLQAIADASSRLAVFGSTLVLCNVPRQVLRLVAITDIWADLEATG
jgi:anti-sigma B factor antagonist